MISTARATIQELPKLIPMATEFFEQSKSPDSFDSGVFIASWAKFIEGNIGQIFVLKEEDEMVGMLGGIIYPDVNSGALLATEFFWWTDDKAKGHGLKLLKEFEEWAKTFNVKGIVMVNLAHMDSGRLGKFYNRMGYREMETHYIKEMI